MNLKRCTACGEEKPETREFYYFARGKAYARCKVCWREYLTARRRARGELPREERLARMRGATEKTCPKCTRTLPRTAEFWPRDRSRGCGLHPYCRACHVAESAATKKQLKPKQKEAARLRGREWYAEKAKSPEWRAARNARRRASYARMKVTG